MTPTTTIVMVNLCIYVLISWDLWAFGLINDFFCDVVTMFLLFGEVGSGGNGF